MAKITSPVKGFKGKVAGVVFEDGTATTDDKNAIAYFRRKGYGIGSQAPRGKAALVEPADPRKVSATRRGTPVRDAAVDPAKDDFLAPANAGDGNPHGPESVSPQVHGSQGARPIRGGDVHVDDPDAQDAAETEHTEAAQDGTVSGSETAADLKGAELDQALEDAGLSKSGSADEKRARLAEYRGEA